MAFENLLCRADQIPIKQFSQFNYFKDGVAYAVAAAESYPTDFTEADCEDDFPKTAEYMADHGLIAWQAGTVLLYEDATTIEEACNNLGLSGYQSEDVPPPAVQQEE